MWKTHPEVYLTSKKLVSIQKLPMNESKCFPSFNSCLKMSLPEGIPQNSRCGSHLHFNTNITSCSDCWGSARNPNFREDVISSSVPIRCSPAR